MVIPGQQGVARSVNPVSAINQGEQQQYTLQLVQPGTGKKLHSIKEEIFIVTLSNYYTLIRGAILLTYILHTQKHDKL